MEVGCVALSQTDETWFEFWVLVVEFMAEQALAGVKHYAQNWELRLNNPFRTAIYERFLVKRMCFQVDLHLFESHFGPLFFSSTL